MLMRQPTPTSAAAKEKAAAVVAAVAVAEAEAALNGGEMTAPLVSRRALALKTRRNAPACAMLAGVPFWMRRLPPRWRSSLQLLGENQLAFL